MVAKFKKDFNLNSELFYSNLTQMLDEVKPKAVAVFTSTYGHLEVVEKCAPLGIHVMVEKPLAVNSIHARKMADLANKYNIKLITNYETTWHPSVKEMKNEVFDNKSIGKLIKVIFHHGNNGVVKGKKVDEFFNWLTDPKQNGGGAVMDFGCYGINIITWLLDISFSD